MTKNFTEIGRTAYLNGEPCAPAINVEVIEAIAELPVGGGALQIMKDFVSGWTAANLAAEW